MLRARSFRRGTFTLASGRTSDFFIDCKPTVLSAEGHWLVGEALCDALPKGDRRPAAVAGVVLGGCPLASAVALVSHHRGEGLDAVLVRKQAKGHGTGAQLEGAAHLKPGDGIVVVEDTVTTGGSTLRAVDALEKAGFTAQGVLAVVDRLEGAGKAFSERGLPFRALFTRRDFIPGDET